MRKIDLEHHFYDNTVIDVMANRSANKDHPYYDRNTDKIYWNDMVSMPQGQLLKTLLDVGELRIGRMDKWGIDMAVISCAPGIEQLSAATAIPVCRSANNAVWALMKMYPGRFVGSCVLPIMDIGAALVEMERCVKAYGFVCWHTHSNYNGALAPDNDIFRPLFKKATELGIYVYLHPQLTDTPWLSDFGFTIAGPALGFTVNTLVTATRMMVGGIFDDIPDLKIVIGHLGEGLPFFLERMENRVNFQENPKLVNQHPLKYYLQNNIWLSTSGNMSKAAFKCTLDVVGIDHIVMGSDYPFENLDGAMSFLDSLPLSSNQRECMFHMNAEELLKIPI